MKVNPKTVKFILELIAGLAGAAAVVIGKNYVDTPNSNVGGQYIDSPRE